MSPKLQTLCALLQNAPPASPEAIAALEATIGKPIPADYRDFLLASNGGEGVIAGGTLALRLLPVEEIAVSTAAYGFEEGLWHLGGDGAGTALLLDTRGRSPRFGTGSFITGDGGEPSATTFTAMLAALVKKFPAPRERKPAKKAAGKKAAPSVPPLPGERLRLDVLSADDCETLNVALDQGWGLLFTCYRRELAAWELSTGKTLYAIKRATGDLGKPYTFSMLADGRLLIAGMHARWHDPATGNLLESAPIPAGYDLFVGPTDGRHVCVLSWKDHTCGCYDLHARAVLARVEADELTFMPGSAYALAGKKVENGRWRLLEVPSLSERFAVEHAGHLLGSAAVAGDTLVLALSKRERVGEDFVYSAPMLVGHDLNTGAVRYALPLPMDGKQFSAHLAAIPGMATVLATIASATRSLGIYDARTGAVIRTLADGLDPHKSFASLAVDPTGTLAVADGVIADPRKPIGVYVFALPHS
jgi:hypothetical protein